MMQHLQYNPSQCIECGECLLCPTEAISSISPLTINNDCIDCEQCIDACPKGQKVLRMGYDDELGGGWVSPFGYQASTNPSQSKKDDSTSENPSKPSNPSDKDSSQDSSTDSSEESKGESSQEPSTKPSTDKPTTPTNPTISPEIDSIYAPPPSKIQASIKVINAIDSLRQYLQTIS